MQKTTKRIILKDKDSDAKPKLVRANSKRSQMKLKIKSNPGSKTRIPAKIAANGGTVANVFTDEAVPSEQTFNFLDKNGSKINKNHNVVSKSMGRDTFNHQNKVKILEPQYETAVKPAIENSKETFRKARNMTELSTC